MEAGLFRLAPRRSFFTQADSNCHAGISQIVGVSMALGAITHNSDLLVLDEGQIGIFVVINVHGFLSAQHKKTAMLLAGGGMPLTVQWLLYLQYPFAASNA